MSIVSVCILSFYVGSRVSLVCRVSRVSDGGLGCGQDAELDLSVHVQKR